jgi:hypothetical protein
MDTEIQLPEKYKQNFDVSSEGPSSDLLQYLYRVLHLQIVTKIYNTT